MVMVMVMVRVSGTGGLDGGQIIDCLVKVEVII